MWRILGSAVLFFAVLFGRGAPAFAEDRKEIHVSIRPQGIPPNIDRWAYQRHTKVRILGDHKEFERATQGLQVFVYDPDAPPANNCILKPYMDERHETARVDIHLPDSGLGRCGGGGAGGASPQGAGAAAARALAQAGAVASVSSPAGEKPAK